MKRLFTILAIVLPLCLQAQVSTTRPSAFTEAIGKRPVGLSQRKTPPRQQQITSSRKARRSTNDGVAEIGVILADEVYKALLGDDDYLYLGIYQYSITYNYGDLPYHYQYHKNWNDSIWFGWWDSDLYWNTYDKPSWYNGEYYYSSSTVNYDCSFGYCTDYIRISLWGVASTPNIPFEGDACYYITALNGNTLSYQKIDCETGIQQNDPTPTSPDNKKDNENGDCTFYLDLFDYNGDGWEGAYIELIPSDECDWDHATVTLSDGQYISQPLIDTVHCEYTAFKWHSGKHDKECSFAIRKPNGEALYTHIGPYYGGLKDNEVFYTFYDDPCKFGNTPNPYTPQNVRLTGGSDDKLVLQWDAVPTAVAYCLHLWDSTHQYISYCDTTLTEHWTTATSWAIERPLPHNGVYGVGLWAYNDDAEQLGRIIDGFTYSHPTISQLTVNLYIPPTSTFKTDNGLWAYWNEVAGSYYQPLQPDPVHNNWYTLTILPDPDNIAIYNFYITNANDNTGQRTYKRCNLYQDTCLELGEPLNGSSDYSLYISECPEVTYCIEVDVYPQGSGIIYRDLEPVEGNCTYPGGSIISYYARATSPDYVFKGWYVAKYDEWYYSDTIYVPANENLFILAVFELGYYCLNLSVGSGGSVKRNIEPEEGTCGYKSGTTVQYTAYPDEGYRFKGWLLDGKEVVPKAGYRNDMLSVTADADHTIEAVFEEDITYHCLYYTIKGGVANINITPEPEEKKSSCNMFRDGTRVCLTLTYDKTLYKDPVWRVNGQTVTASNDTYCLTMKEDKNVTITLQKRKQFIVNISASYGGEVNDYINGNYTEQTPPQILIAEVVSLHNGYSFYRWSDFVSTPSRLLTIDRDWILTARFQHHSTGSKTTIITAPDASAECKTFLYWNDGVTAVSRTVNQSDKDKYYPVYKESLQFPVNIHPNDNLMGEVVSTDLPRRPLSDTTYTECDTLNIAAIPTNRRYKFVGWSDGNTTPERTLIFSEATDANAYNPLIAIFKPVADNSTGQDEHYRLRLEAIPKQGGELIALQPTNGDTLSVDSLYNLNDSIQVTARPAAGYRFLRWSDNETDTVRLFVMTQDYILRAIFARDEYTLTLLAETGGAVNTEVNGAYPPYSQIDAIPIADEGYQFTGWSNGTKDSICHITLNQDTVVTATFRPLSCHLEVYNTAGGIVETDSSLWGDYPYGSTVHLQAAADDGYSFLGWAALNDTIDITATQEQDWDFISTDNRLRLQLTRDTMLIAVFKQMKEYAFYIESQDTLMGRVVALVAGDTIPNDTTLWEGTDIQIKAEQAKGYRFFGWQSIHYVEQTDPADPLSLIYIPQTENLDWEKTDAFTLTQDTIIQAVFRKQTSELVEVEDVFGQVSIQVVDRWLRCSTNDAIPADFRLYSVTGQLIATRRNTPVFEQQVPIQGIYILQINNQHMRLLIP